MHRHRLSDTAACLSLCSLTLEDGDCLSGGSCILQSLAAEGFVAWC
jgi:hypothetical protein